MRFDSIEISLIASIFTNLIDPSFNPYNYHYISKLSIYLPLPLLKLIYLFQTKNWNQLQNK